MLFIKKALSAEDLQQCLSIRFIVFVEGQNVPLAEEIDGKDNESTHYLAFANQHPVGTARVRFVDDYSKIERVAILDEYQGKGFGRDIMQHILTNLRNCPSVKKAKLSSQTHAILFYEKLGFSVCSEEYLDANIPHKDMQLIL